jgi:transcriptional regulator with PAS, ATPase and Fis domain
LIREVLARTGGNRTRAAQILGIDRVSLWRKIKRLGIDV